MGMCLLLSQSAHITQLPQMKEKSSWLGVVHTVQYYINHRRVNIFSLFLVLEHNEIKEALLL